MLQISPSCLRRPIRRGGRLPGKRGAMRNVECSGWTWTPNSLLLSPSRGPGLQRLGVPSCLRWDTLALWLTLSLPSYTAEDHLPKDGTAHSGLWALPHQSSIKTISHRCGHGPTTFLFSGDSRLHPVDNKNYPTHKGYTPSPPPHQWIVPNPECFPILVDVCHALRA